jgi:hypothetical protein
MTLLSCSWEHLAGRLLWRKLKSRHQHEPHQEMKETPSDKGLSMKGEMKHKMKEKMKDMKCCSKEKQKQPKS